MAYLRMGVDEAKADERQNTRRVIACEGKIQYDSYRAAHTAVINIQHRSKSKINVYRCDHCKKYHAGGNRTRRIK